VHSYNPLVQINAQIDAQIEAAAPQAEESHA